MDNPEAEEICEFFGEDLSPKCQMKAIGLAPSDGLEADGTTLALIADHKAWLEASFPASVGAHDLVRVFSSESAMEGYITGSDDYGLTADKPLLALGVVWNAPYPNYDYSLRMNATSLFDTRNSKFDHFAKMKDWTDLECNQYGGTSLDDSLKEIGGCAARYLDSSLPAYQTYIVDSFILEQVSVLKTGSVPDFFIKANTAGFPSEGFSLDIFWDFLADMFSTMLFLTFLGTFYNVISQVAEEKDLLLSEGMKMMGLTDFQMSLSWWTVFTIQFAIIAGAITAMSDGAFKFSDKPIIFFYFFSFLMSCTSFCIFITAFFSSARKVSPLTFHFSFPFSLFPFLCLSFFPRSLAAALSYLSHLLLHFPSPLSFLSLPPPCLL